jgi:hypothetical protein
MLWIVDNAGLPCTQAAFVRVGAQRCFTVTDRSTFSIHEVNALLAGGSPATFPRALYVVLDGFLPHELGSPIVAPALTFTFDSAEGAAVPSMTASMREVLLEDPSAPPDVAQRATFVFDVRFADATAFAGFPERRSVNVRARHGSHTCDAALTLTQQPNPYMVDGPVSWLSVDLRVFQIRAGMTRAGVTHGSGDGSPQPFLTQFLTTFNAAPNDEYHPFLDITPEQQASGLELAREVNGQRVFNYAVAKVRYRATTVPANDVKVFFRSFNTVGTSLEYNPATTYRRAGTGPNAIPLLGVQGTSVMSIPFFAEARIDTATASMATQTDPLNGRILSPAGAQEFIGYYGAWLDFNQTTPRFPLTISGDGPFTDRLSIQQHVRGRHQCLVAEVFFEPDPIPFGATPGSSENLAQRNLAIVESTNPGSVATRTVQHTFEIKPSALPQIFALAVVHPAELEGGTRYIGPDEVVFTWNDLPPGTRATLFMPDVEADEVLELAAARNGPPRLERVDEHTIACLVEDITFVPIPAGRTVNIPALLSLSLPEGVTKGVRFRVLVQQYSGVTGRIVGAFELLIPVSTADIMLPVEIRTLSVLRHIAEAIPVGDRWFPVFNRYLAEIEDRVDGLGGDPDDVEPSPDGTGKRPREQDCDPWKLRWVVPAVVAALAVLVGTVDTDVAAPLAAAGAVLLLGALCGWIARCRPTACDVITSLLLGLAIAAGVLGLIRLLGEDGDRLADTFGVVGIAVAALMIAALLLRCFPARWCRACPPRAVGVTRAARLGPVESPPAAPPRAPVEEPGFRGRVERDQLAAHGHDEHGSFAERPHDDR